MPALPCHLRGILVYMFVHFVSILNSKFINFYPENLLQALKTLVDLKSRVSRSLRLYDLSICTCFRRKYGRIYRFLCTSSNANTVAASNTNNGMAS